MKSAFHCDRTSPAATPHGDSDVLHVKVHVDRRKIRSVGADSTLLAVTLSKILVLAMDARSLADH